MSKWTEYLSLIPKGLPNLRQIAEGVINNIKLQYGHLPEEVVDEIIRRRLICAACPFMSENAKVDPALNYKTDRPEEHCIMCGCPLTTKTSSMAANCGIENHNAAHPDQKMELRWTAYQKPTTNNE